MATPPDDRGVSFFSRVLRFPGANSGEDASDRRHSGRVMMESSLQCSLGRVVDLSAGGLCVLSRRALSGVTLIELRDDDGGFVCEARVVRSRRLGFFRHEVGLQLPPLDDQHRAMMTRFCANHRDRLSVHEREAA